MPNPSAYLILVFKGQFQPSQVPIQTSIQLSPLTQRSERSECRLPVLFSRVANSLHFSLIFSMPRAIILQTAIIIIIFPNFNIGIFIKERNYER
jgi:hypothetical protein